MKWAHLPVAGGIYDQSPEFVDQVSYIIAERNKYQSAEQEKKQRQAKAQTNAKKTPAAGRVRGRRGK